MPQYELIGFGSNDRESQMTPVRAVDSAEREQIAEAVGKLWEFGHALSVYLLFTENHAALENFWSQAGHEHARTGAFDEAIANRLSIELNRHLTTCWPLSGCSSIIGKPG